MSERAGRVLVLGYGNPGRRDDGLGPALAARIEVAGLPGVETDADYQLTIEDAAAMACFERVLFADASHDAEAPCELRRLEPAPAIEFSSHTITAEAVVAICEEHFGPAPEAWMLAIRGYEFDFAEGLTERATHNLDRATAFVHDLIRQWKETKQA